MNPLDTTAFEIQCVTHEPLSATAITPRDEIITVYDPNGWFFDEPIEDLLNRRGYAVKFRDRWEVHMLALPAPCCHP